jgi:hypothetical protein
MDIVMHIYLACTVPTHDPSSSRLAPLRSRSLYFGAYTVGSRLDRLPQLRSSPHALEKPGSTGRSTCVQNSNRRRSSMVVQDRRRLFASWRPNVEWQSHLDRQHVSSPKSGVIGSIPGDRTHRSLLFSDSALQTRSGKQWQTLVVVRDNGPGVFHQRMVRNDACCKIKPRSLLFSSRSGDISSPWVDNEILVRNR